MRALRPTAMITWLGSCVLLGDVAGGKWALKVQDVEIWPALGEGCAMGVA